MIENNTTLCLFQCISILFAKIKFFKKNSMGGKNKLLWWFRAHISYIHRFILFAPTGLAESYRCSTYVKNLQIHTILIENIRCEYL